MSASASSNRAAGSASSGSERTRSAAVRALRRFTSPSQNAAHSAGSRVRRVSASNAYPRTVVSERRNRTAKSAAAARTANSTRSLAASRARCRRRHRERAAPRRGPRRSPARVRRPHDWPSAGRILHALRRTRCARRRAASRAPGRVRPCVQLCGCYRQVAAASGGSWERTAILCVGRKNRRRVCCGPPRANCPRRGRRTTRGARDRTSDPAGFSYDSVARERAGFRRSWGWRALWVASRVGRTRVAEATNDHHVTRSGRRCLAASATVSWTLLTVGSPWSEFLSIFSDGYPIAFAVGLLTSFAATIYVLRATRPSDIRKFFHKRWPS